MKDVRRAVLVVGVSTVFSLTVTNVVVARAGAAPSTAAVRSSTAVVTPVRLLRAPAITERAPFDAHGGVDEAYALHASPGEKLLAVNRAGEIVGRGHADRLGSLIVRNLAPGRGYTFRSVQGTEVLGTGRLQVLGPHQVPPETFYAGQHMHAGLNYLTMRDGVKLAATLRLPPGKTLADGPFPTVIEYSGYAIAAPGNLIDAYLNPAANKNNPLLPDTATAVGSIITPLIGFATVSLQMRGTGCSGGAFDLFGLNTTDDGYDAVRIVSAQPWVLGHRVGMVGISYSGISQLFVAGARPPGLAAIAPMSITNDLYATGYPGGMLNSGFAAGWLNARIQDAKPAPQGGQAYAKALIADGDHQCLANQALHLQTLDVKALLGEAQHRDPTLYDIRSPSTWAKKINVPTFLSGALQDEQTGPQWPAIIPDLSRDPFVWVSMINGTHIDSLGPEMLSRWIAFLDIFVAHRVPTQPGIIDALAPLFYKDAAGAPAEAPPPVPFTSAPSPMAARADFVHEVPRVDVYFGNGAGSAGPGALQPVWAEGFSSWPPVSVVPTTYFLGRHGRLQTARPARGRASFRPNPAARPATDLPAGANAWAAEPPYDWTPVVGGEGIGFLSPPLRHDLVLAGPASLDLQVRSTAADTDLQATVSDVMTNGEEMYITSGFLRASDRVLDTRSSTALAPVPTYLASEARPIPPGAFVKMRIPIDPVVHVFRAGSRIRVIVSAPGGDRPLWVFATYQTGGKVLDTVALGGVHPSTLVLPVVRGVHPPAYQTACPSLRGEPCRTYVPAGNGG